jgi:hypothetical protein
MYLQREDTVLIGSGLIVPRAHRETVFDPTSAEWNAFHAHLHIIPRHKDEPHAGKGIRHWLSREENKRK